MFLIIILSPIYNSPQIIDVVYFFTMRVERARAQKRGGVL